MKYWERGNNMYLVSACLVGVKCRYDGNDNEIETIKELVNKGQAVPVCPEQLGGLSTPRDPAEIVGDKIMTKNGKDVTEAFYLGAERTLAIAKVCGCKKAILKAKSPSCGCGKVYDGTFSGRLVAGEGITAKLLKQEGIEIYTEENYSEGK